MWGICLLVSSVGCGEVLLPDAGPGDAQPPQVDATQADAGLDAGLPSDSGVLPDTGVPEDTGVWDDTGVSADTGAPEDTGVPHDTGVPVDTGVSEDAGAPDAQLDAGPQMATVSLRFVGDGGGTVRWPDNTICNADCTRQFIAGSAVDLVASANMSAVFVSWAGSPSCGAGTTCTVQPNMDLSIDVRFDALHSVSVTPLGDGLGRVDGLNALCAPGCTETHATGTRLTLTAVPAAGVRFTGWSGACSGAQSTCNVSVTGPTMVQPNWQVITPQIGQSPGGHFCALLGPRSVRCWGEGIWGQLGRQSNETIGDDESVASQGDLPLGLDIVQVATGGTFTCVLQKSGAVRCWGLNNYGQLGQGHTTSVGQSGGAAPANIPDIDLGGPALQVSLGGWHACARMAAGTVRCWGRGLEGQLGYGDTNNVADGSTAVLTPALAGYLDLGGALRVESIAAGAYHSCAVFEDGSAKCWGSNADGQLGYPFAGQVGDGNAQRPLPRDVATLPLGVDRIQELRAATDSTCALFMNGRIKCWGKNSEGQLGTGDFMGVGGSAGRALSLGVDVSFGGAPATYIALGAGHACAVVSGAVRCWGLGGFGRLGDGASMNRSTASAPVNLGAGYTVTAVGATGINTCAIQHPTGQPAALEARCWGKGTTGGLGTGMTMDVGAQPSTMPPIVTPLY